MVVGEKHLCAATNACVLQQSKIYIWHLYREIELNQLVPYTHVYHTYANIKGNKVTRNLWRHYMDYTEHKYQYTTRARVCVCAKST